MLSWLTKFTPRKFLLELPPLGAALTVTEVYVKLGSFTLEAVACVALWFFAREAHRAFWKVVLPHAFDSRR